MNERIGFFQWRDLYLHRRFAHAMQLVIACLRVVGTYLELLSAYLMIFIYTPISGSI